MGIKIKELIEKLQEQDDQDREVESLICDKEGQLVCVKIEDMAGHMKKIVNMFAG